MNFKLNTIVILSLALVINTYAQDAEQKTISVKGTVLDASTKAPVSAKIKYESLPYGSRIGVFSGDTFTFSMEDGNDYKLEVSADGYTTHTETLKLSENVDGLIEKTVELSPNGINRLMRLEKLIFALGKDEITPESFDELNDLVNMLNANPTMTIQLEGHTDFRGNAQQNMKLSERRVESVKDYLTKKGINKNRIKTKAFGGNQPLSRENDAESRSQNRRVEVRILSN
ncbi:MAG TPA: OmpA family protein [Fulvivirga sp.]|nr:OmpA family protein [Fulvivirga sp.]